MVLHEFKGISPPQCKLHYAAQIKCIVHVTEMLTFLCRDDSTCSPPRWGGCLTGVTGSLSRKRLFEVMSLGLGWVFMWVFVIGSKLCLAGWAGESTSNMTQHSLRWLLAHDFLDSPKWREIFCGKHDFFSSILVGWRFGESPFMVSTGFTIEVFSDFKLMMLPNS